MPSTAIQVDKDGKEFVTGVTDSLGNFQFTLPVGVYVLMAAHSEAPFLVTGNKPATVDLILKPKKEVLQFFDEPQFTVAGVTDNTYRGGHGSDSVLRSSETLTRATSSLGGQSQTGNIDEPHHVRAEQEEHSGNSLEAVREFQKAAELNPSETNLFDWGTELLSHRAPQAAADVFERGSTLFPHSVRMLLGLATSWYAAGYFDKAARCFFEAIDGNPHDRQSYAFLNQAQAGEITQAPGYHERFARFVALHPEDAWANYYYAVSLWQRRRGPDDLAAFDQARTFLQKAVALDSHLALAFLQLGILDAEQVRYPEAIAAFEKAVGENPDLDEAHYRLSEAYRLTGNQVKSAQELTIYQTLSKRSSEKSERERRQVRQFVMELKNTSR